MTQTKTLYRLPDQALLSGVVAGLAEYLDIDRSLARLLYLFITLATGVVPGVVTYIIMLIILPTPDQAAIEVEAVAPNKTKSTTTNDTSSDDPSSNAARNVIGGGFIVVGGWYLLSALSLLPAPQWQTVMPLLLIIFGVLLLKKQ